MQPVLMQHQKDGIEFVLNNKGIAALHWDPGCGKTLGALSVYSVLKQNEPDLKLLVICPISLIHGAWVKEIEKFTDYNWMDLHGGAEKFIEKKGGTHIYLLNFEYLVSVRKFNTLKEILSQKGLCSRNWMVVIDESSKMKNHQGVITSRLIGYWEKKKFIPGIKQFCKYRIELSGTPAPNIEWEYWAQMKFLEDSILGENFYKFRNKYFNLQRGRDIIPGSIFNKAALREAFNNGYKYEFDENYRQEFFDRIKPWCHVVKAKDCLDLPETVDEYRVFDMEGEQARVYKEMKTEYIAEIKNIVSNPIAATDPAIENLTKEDYSNGFIVANIILTKMMKLRQITSSFAINDKGEAIPIDTKIPEKLKILLEIIEEIGNEQIIIWCQFKWEIWTVVNALKNFGQVAELHGGVLQDKRIEHINSFLENKSRFLVANAASASHGLTFVNARYACYFSMDYSFEEYEQSRKRIHRYGQKNNCVYYHILARNSVDEEILAICQKKATKQMVAERFLKS